MKFVNGQDADTKRPARRSGVDGDLHLLVTNTGGEPLGSVVVTDDKLGTIAGPASGDTNANGLLDLTETSTCTTTATALAGQQTNMGAATGQGVNTAQTVSDDNPANYFGDAPAIQIVKFVNGQDADTANRPAGRGRLDLTFTYVVTNTGNVPLANVAVTDDKLRADHLVHRRHECQRPARPDRNLDLHRHRHSPGGPTHQHGTATGQHANSPAPQSATPTRRTTSARVPWARRGSTW